MKDRYWKDKNIEKSVDSLVDTRSNLSRASVRSTRDVGDDASGEFLTPFERR